MDRNGNERWIVLSSANGSSNLGDECMWEAAVDVLRAERGPVLVVADSAPEWISPHEQVELLPFLSSSLRRGYQVLGPRWAARLPLLEKVLSRPGRDRFARRRARAAARRPRGALQWEWHKQVMNSTGVIVSGAGAINDDFSSHGVASWFVILSWARDAGKPIAMIGQGLGPLRDPGNRALARELLEIPSVITVREAGSLRQLTDLGLEPRVTVTPDWALAATPRDSDRAQAASLLAEIVGDAKFVAFSLHRRHSTRSADLDVLAKVTLDLLREARRRGRKALFLPNMTAGLYSDDRETADLIVHRWPEAERARLLRTPEPLSPGVTRSILGAASALVATRYHPLVFAFAEGTPVWGISYDAYYDQKLIGASAIFGVSQNVARLEDDHPNTGMVFDALESQRPVSITEEVLNSIRSPLISFLRASTNPDDAELHRGSGSA